MIPTVAFTHPNQLARVIQPFEEVLPAVVDEGFALLIHDRAGFAGFRIHADNPQDLMAALVVAKSETARILLPTNVHATIFREGIWK